jgi:hypothetical protein
MIWHLFKRLLIFPKGLLGGLIAAILMWTVVIFYYNWHAVITPDADSRAAMGTNQMDPATRIPAARAGFTQGKQEATRLAFL